MKSHGRKISGKKTCTPKPANAGASYKGQGMKKTKVIGKNKKA